jgi:hypothetical protein
VGVMQIIREFGKYKIVGEKVDRCPCEYVDGVDFWAYVIGALSFSCIFVSLNYQNILYSTGFSFIFLITFALGCLISDCWYSCGIKVKLMNADYIDLTIRSVSYQFTNNPDYDAQEITKIADELEKYANEIDLKNKKVEDEKRAKSDECCNKYKSVITKVK